ncbi:MAG TPA: 16S rRNA (guanine(527)-N(7))-methyltransferase RsmG [Actinopolymorphaceae bacterium]
MTGTSDVPERPDVPDPPDPAVVEQLFGAAAPVARRYAALLAGPGVERGLLGPREVPRLWDRHLLNCAVLAPALPARSTLCDLGSGAGLPGLVLAVIRPDVEVTLLEPLLRRTTFLTEVVAELDLANVRVVRARAEDHSGVYDVVTARAVAPLDRLAALALPLGRAGGSVLAMKGQRAEAELTAARKALRRLGADSWEIERYGVGLLEPPTTVVRIRAAA